MRAGAFEEAFSSTTGQVLDYIIRGLATGRYKPGERLNAAVLCRELGLSKAPVREALHVLAGEGLVNMPKNRGAFIRDLTRADLLRLWEVFALSFGREIRFAARNIAQDGARGLVANAIGAIRDEAERGPRIEFFGRLHEFHAAATAIADNPFLISPQMRRLGEFWLPYIFRAIPLEIYLRDYVGNYERIAAPLMAGDGVSAEAAFHYHAAWSAAIVRGERPIPGGPWSPEAPPPALLEPDAKSRRR